MKTITEKKGFELVNPSHPGEFIREEIIRPLKLSVTDAARVLGVTRVTLSNLLNGHAALSPEMAIRVEKAFGVSMDTLLRMQCAYDIAQARRQEQAIHVKRFHAA